MLGMWGALGLALAAAVAAAAVAAPAVGAPTTAPPTTAAPLTTGWWDVSGRSADARHVSEGAARQQSVDVLLTQATAAAERGDWDAARRLLLDARRLTPRRADVLFELGVTLERLGDPVAAIDVYREAVALDARILPAIENLAALLADHGDLDGAVYLLTTALQQHPDAASLHYHRALLVFRREQRLVSPAIEGLQRALGLGYSRPHLFLLLGRVARVGGDAAAARKLLQQGLDQTPEDTELLHEMGLSLAALGDLDASVEHLASAARLAPTNPDLAVDLARVQLRAGRPTEVLTLLGRFNDEPDALYLFGQAQQALGRPEAKATLERFQALQARAKVAREAEARAMVEVGAGVERWDAGDIGSAAGHFERALLERPGWATALSYLAAARLESGETDTAIELATTLLASNESNAQALMVLGRARLSLSDATGLALLERAAKLYPYRTICLLTLAQAYVDLGRDSDAAPFVDRAARIEPDHPWVAELRHYLEPGAR